MTFPKKIDDFFEPEIKTEATGIVVFQQPRVAESVMIKGITYRLNL